MIAANAGGDWPGGTLKAESGNVFAGAWSPIGDVTTTMLWIQPGTELFAWTVTVESHCESDSENSAESCLEVLQGEDHGHEYCAVAVFSVAGLACACLASDMTRGRAKSCGDRVSIHWVRRIGPEAM